MKKVIFIIILLFLLPQGILGLRNKDISNLKFDSVNDLLNDTIIASQLNADRVIVYYNGYHVYNWCIVYKRLNRFHIINGTINKRTLSYDSTNFDTTDFFHKNYAIFDWALDSLMTKKRFITSKHDVKYTPFGKGLKIYKRSEPILEISDNIHYNDNDSINFTRKLSRLYLLLYYLSSPDIRKYIPIERIK